MAADGAIAAARSLDQLSSLEQQRLLAVLRTSTSPDQAGLIARNADANLAVTQNALSSGSERLVLTNPNHVSAVAVSPQGVNNAIDALGRGSRSTATDPIAEVIALQELEDLQLAALAGGLADPHGLSRHGALTTLEQQYLRSTTGIRPDRPDTANLRPTPASRSTSHVAHLQTLQEARLLISGVGTENVWLRFNDARTIGEGFQRQGTDYFTAPWIRITFRDGQWLTNSFFATDVQRNAADLLKVIP